MKRPTLIRIDRVNCNNIPPSRSLRGIVAHADCKLMAKRDFAKLFLPQCTAHAQYRGSMLDREAIPEHGPRRARAKSPRTETGLIHP
ncbi:hypothetical protein [Bradyrhizobium sp. WSM3983]|uniref:hypothetical protein n=1 Tax=Bradyrhizobium sp. WSM3983 TaxID=1038867 RepID=UPI0018DE3572|nr:hypothetical protein [Bradyrhizobium sp. WSM3983]